MSSASSSINELYECYEIVNNKDEKDDAKKSAYQKILEGVNGEEKEKRLAAQFISRFFKLYPELYEESFNKLLDLCEDDNVTIRKQVIQYLPSVGKAVAEYVAKIADTLTQMLVSDDNSEILLIYAALNTVLKLDFKVALEAIFHQLITQLEEANELINTFAFKYLNEKLSSETSLEAEMETFVEASCKKLLTKLIGREEYSLVIGILSALKVNSTLIGRQKLVNEISDQTKLLLKLDDPRKFATLMSNCKQTVKLLSKNVHADSLLLYMLESLGDVVTLCSTQNSAAAATVPPTVSNCQLFDYLKYIVDLINRGQSSETNNQLSATLLATDSGLQAVKLLFQLVVSTEDTKTTSVLPAVPAEGTEEAIAKLSEDRNMLLMVEVSLLALYYLAKCRPEALTQDEEATKEFKKKLQFLGRVNQAASKTAGDSAAKLNNTITVLDDNIKGEKAAFVKAISNIQVLIREFFKSPPSFKSIIIPSWNTVAVEAAVKAVPAATKRPAKSGGNPGGPAKTRVLSNNRGGNYRRRGGVRR